LPIPRKIIEHLPGQKFSIVLEVDVNNIFPYAHSDWFDAYLVIDPTKTKYNNVYPFPRPLELIGELPNLLSEKVPVLGSFGLLTGGKDFGDLIRYANDIGKSIVRINLPPVTYMGDIGICVRLTDYANKLKRLAKSYVDVRITHDYLEKPELIRWLAQNTINVFPYYRNQPGLAAVTDQAISANRPIAVTDCNTFRHMHPYISYYPKYSITELIENSMDGVKKMQEDWHPFRFKDKFEELLKQQGIL
jgi:glycosyltransferase involved in cell wall biosynthesis